MRKRHIHPIHVHGLSKSGNLRCFLPLYNSHPPKPEPCIFLYAPFTKEYFIVVLQELWRFAIIRELPSPLMFAFIGEQAGFGASHLSDSSRVSVAKQPNH